MVTYADVGATQEGDIVFARVVHRSNASVDGLTTAPAAFSLDSEYAHDSTLHAGLYIGAIGAGLSDTWGFDGVQDANGWSVTYIVFRGADTELDVAPSYNTDGSFGTAQPPAPTPLTDGAAIVCGGELKDNRASITLSVDQGFTLDDVFDTTSGADHSVYTAHKILETAAAQTAPTFSNAGGSRTWYGYAFVVKPAAGGGGGGGGGGAHLLGQGVW